MRSWQWIKTKIVYMVGKTISSFNQSAKVHPKIPLEISYYKDTTKAQRRPSARFNKKKKQSENDKKAWSVFTDTTQDSADSSKQARKENENKVAAGAARNRSRKEKRSKGNRGEHRSGTGG